MVEDFPAGLKDCRFPPEVERRRIFCLTSGWNEYPWLEKDAMTTSNGLTCTVDAKTSEDRH